MLRWHLIVALELAGVFLDQRLEADGDFRIVLKESSLGYKLGINRINNILPKFHLGPFAYVLKRRRRIIEWNTARSSPLR